MNKIMLSLFICSIILLVFSYFSISHETNERNLACQELGLRSYEYVGDMYYCEDKEGNLHYIKMDCKHWYWVDCTAKLISVGDVRVR